MLQTFKNIGTFVVICLLLAFCFADAYPHYTHFYIHDDDGEGYDGGQQDPADLMQVFGGTNGGYGGRYRG